MSFPEELVSEFLIKLKRGDIRNRRGRHIQLKKTGGVSKKKLLG